MIKYQLMRAKRARFFLPPTQIEMYKAKPFPTEGVTEGLYVNFTPLYVEGEFREHEAGGRLDRL